MLRNEHCCMCNTRMKTKDNNILLIHVVTSSELLPTILSPNQNILEKQTIEINVSSRSSINIEDHTHNYIIFKFLLQYKCAIDLTVGVVKISRKSTQKWW